jgi:hypothetical protein
MSALPQTSLPQPLPQGSEWIDLPTAAQRSGRTVGHLSNTCRKKYAAQNLAKKQQPADGGAAIWYVRETADPAFAKVKSVEQLSAAFDSTPLTDKQRLALAARKQILDGWLDAVARAREGESKDDITDRYVATLAAAGTKCSRPTLYNYQRDFRREGMAGLVDPRWLKNKRQAAPQEDDPFFSYLRRLYLKRPPKSLQWCFDVAEQKAIEEGWNYPSFKTCQRYIARLPRQLVVWAREGKKAFEDKCEPYIERDYASLAANDWWCSDEHKFDVMVRVPGQESKFFRPRITGWEDLASRKIISWKITLHDANTDVVLETFQAAASKYGVPLHVLVDNGKPYDNEQTQGVSKHKRLRGEKINYERMDGAFVLLGLKVHHAKSYHGQSKPIERAFRTVCDRFAKTCPTYCGNKPANRPEDLQKKLNAGQAPTFDEFVARFESWLEHDYHNRGHGGDAMDDKTPNQVYRQRAATARPVLAESLRLACMSRFGPRTVGKGGVVHQGMHYGGFDAAVQKYHGQQVMVAVDRGDLSYVLVLDLDGKLIGRANKNLKLPFGAKDEDLREAHRQKKQLKKTIATYHDNRRKIGEDTHQLVQRASIRRQMAERGEQFDPKTGEVLPAQQGGPSIRIAQTPFDDQSPAIKRAFEVPLKLAVGAESQSEPERFVYSPAASADAEPAAMTSFRQLLRDGPQRQEDAP